MKPEDGKKIYDSIEIPKELSDVVNRAISSQDKEKIRMNYEKDKRKNNAVRIFRYAAAAAAGLMVCFTIGLNTSEAFAKEMGEMPVIGGLARVLTVRSYHGTDGDYEIDMEVPEIVQETGENGMRDGDENAAAGSRAQTDAVNAFTGDINAEIQKIVDDYMEQSKVEFAEYKEAFFATGGTEEEWNGRTMDINVNYTVKYQKGNILSLELVTSKGWVSAQEERYYYNLDLSTGEYLTLGELLGENYVERCNESIVKQIEQRIAEDENMMYFGFGSQAEEDAEMKIEGFTTVTDETKFYINELGNVVIVFEKYEIAPGYMGFQEFEIGEATIPDHS